MLILASKSPRRKELLALLTPNFSCVNADIDETVNMHEGAHDYVNRLAINKAQAVFDQATTTENTYVLGSDTAVVIDGEILGKPDNQAHSYNMLNKLSGRSHSVYTAVAIVSKGQILTKVVITDVEFRVLSANEINQYWLTGEPQDKAGSYGIQGIAGQFITRINGSYSAVVGLPLCETALLFQQCNIQTLAAAGE